MVDQNRACYESVVSCDGGRFYGLTYCLSCLCSSLAQLKISKFESIPLIDKFEFILLCHVRLRELLPYISSTNGLCCSKLWSDFVLGHNFIGHKKRLIRFVYPDSHAQSLEMPRPAPDGRPDLTLTERPVILSASWNRQRTGSPSA